ncbi:MAG: MATE family efflux transporter [Clostridia bacterium]|nr:MATE family efflux transporter [Clostridia bacterium]
MSQSLNSKPAKGDFGSGSIPKLLVKLALPLMTAELVHVLYNLVDRMYIGHIPGCGTEALSGVGIAFPLITFITAFANLFGSGGNPLCSMARGEGDTKKAQTILNTSFTMLIVTGIVLMVLMYVFSGTLLSWMGGDKDTLPYAVEYFKIYLIGTVFVLISLGMNPFINGMGFARVGMATVIIGAVLNIILDPVFIFTLNMGIKGAAWATVISQLVSAVWVVAFLMGKKTLLRITGFAIDPQQAKRILKLGVSGFTFKSTTSISQAVVNMTLKQFGGATSTLFIGSMSIINSLREVISQPITGFTHAAVPVMSYNRGAGKESRIRQTIKFVLSLAFTYNFCAWLLMMFVPLPFVKIFTTDPELMATAVKCIHVYYGAYFMMTFQTTSQNVFVSMNMPKFSLFFSMLRKIILVVPLTLLLPRIGFGVMGVFWAEFISQLFGASCCFITMMLVVYRHLAKDE